ncbi:MAG: formimidoyltetrahydrofolate cyclodeaminase [Planctomycetota bacterium]|nr:MAG: formimidoyltetrahydrofolate cyclodeaminase [Planctomycetota bacterium]
MATAFSQLGLDAFSGALAERCPAPGGGAAAAVAAAIAAALAAMAANYTNGPRHADVQAQAEALLATCQGLRQRCLALAQADADAYAQVQKLRQAKAEQAAIATAEAEARQIPLQLLALSSELGENLQAFLPACNRWLLADLRAALHLLYGSAQAAREILHAGNPEAPEADEARRICQQLNRICQSLGEPG